MQSYLLTRLREYPARNTSHKKKDLCFAISLHLDFLFFEEDGHEALEKLEGSTRTGGSPILRWSLNRVDEASLECHLSTKSGQTAVPGQPDGRHPSPASDRVAPSRSPAVRGIGGVGCSRGGLVGTTERTLLFGPNRIDRLWAGMSARNIWAHGDNGPDVLGNPIYLKVAHT